MMAALGAELAALLSWGLLALVEDPATLPESVRMLPGLLLLIALATGVLCLLLTPLAYRIRRVPPPGGVVVIAVAVGALPLVAVLLMQLLRGN